MGNGVSCTALLDLLDAEIAIGSCAASSDRVLDDSNQLLRIKGFGDERDCVLDGMISVDAADDDDRDVFQILILSQFAIKSGAPFIGQLQVQGDQVRLFLSHQVEGFGSVKCGAGGVTVVAENGLKVVNHRWGRRQ